MIYVLLGTAFGCALSSSATPTSAAIISSAGGNVTLPCLSAQFKHRHSQHKEVYWQWPGRLEGAQSPFVSQDGSGSLHLPFVTANSSGNYSCFHEADDSLIIKHSLLVPGPPPPPANLSASETDGMIILRWHNTMSAAYLAAAPDTVLRLRYRPLLPQVLLPLPGHAAPHLLQDYNSGPRIWPPGPTPEAGIPTTKWRVLPRALPPNQPLVALQQPSEESCQFEVWAENSYGSSPHVSVTTITRHPASQTFTKAGAWERSRGWLAGVITVLVSCNAAALIWICYHTTRTKRNRRRQRTLANHSGLSGECEQLELVCHAHDPHTEAVSLTLPHHAALV